jgi:hypothetical protein
MDTLEYMDIWIWNKTKLEIEPLNVTTVTDCAPKLIEEASQNTDFNGVTPWGP